VSTEASSWPPPKTLRRTQRVPLPGLKFKKLSPPRDAQVILGHSRISTTLEIYTNVDEPARRDALTRLHGLLDEGQG
jgi:integrase